MKEIQKGFFDSKMAELQEIKAEIDEETEKRKYAQKADRRSVILSKAIFVFLGTAIVTFSTAVLGTSVLGAFAVALPSVGMIIEVGAMLGRNKIKNLLKSEQKIIKQIQYMKDVEMMNNPKERGWQRRHLFELNKDIDELEKGPQEPILGSDRKEEIKWKKEHIKCIQKGLLESSPSRRLMAKWLRPELAERLQKVRTC